MASSFKWRRYYHSLHQVSLSTVPLTINDFWQSTCLQAVLWRNLRLSWVELVLWKFYAGESVSNLPMLCFSLPLLQVGLHTHLFSHTLTGIHLTTGVNSPRWQWNTHNPNLTFSVSAELLDTQNTLIQKLCIKPNNPPAWWWCSLCTLLCYYIQIMWHKWDSCRSIAHVVNGYLLTYCYWNNDCKKAK